MIPPENQEPVPDWLASKIRRAAVFASLEAFFPFAAAAILFLGIALCLAFGVFDQKFPPLFWMAVFLAAAYFLGVPLLVSLRIFLRPVRSQEIAYLRRLGSLAMAVNEITEELRNPAKAAYGKEVVVTNNWLVISGGSRFAVRRLNDLVWVFPKVSTLRLHGALPLWRAHFVVFRCAEGPEAEAKCTKEQGTTLLEQLHGRCAWILLGYDEEAQKHWDADPAAFIAAVRERK